MPNKKPKTQRDNAMRASVKKEMAKPRIAKSARIALLNLATTGIPKPPSTTVSGTVEKILPPASPGKRETAQIGIGEADQRYGNLRIENTLTDEHGEDVKLRKGAQVDVTVTVKRVGS